ncbi:hypothetical protein D3C85_1222270 [compost metagenome]
MLVLEIECRGGLVEQQQAGGLWLVRRLPDLGQHPGKLHPLALPARQAGIEATGQVFNPRMGHGGLHYLVAADAGFGVGQSPHGHHLLTQEREAEGRALGQDPEPVGQLGASPGLPGAAKQVDLAVIFQLAGQALEQ